MTYFLECSSDIDKFVKTHPILEDYKLKVKNIKYRVNLYTIEIKSIEELLKFKESIKKPIIIDSSLDYYIKQYLPEEVKYSIEIYDTYRE